MKNKFIILLSIILILIPTTYIVDAKEDKFNLNGYIIFVDAGHGGKDNGASSNNVLEDTINLSIASMLVDVLVTSGAYVYTTRDGDYDLADNYDKSRKSKDLRKRVRLINQINPNLFISIHLNTYSDEKVNGGQVFYQSNEESKLLAEMLQDNFNDISNQNKKAKLGDYYLLNKSIPIGVIVECGFLTNRKDFYNLQDKEYQRKIANKISEGIYRYFISKKT